MDISAINPVRNLASHMNSILPNIKIANNKDMPSYADISNGVNSATPANPISIDEEKLKRIREAAQSFEAYFISMLIRSMREATPKSGFIGGGNGEETYRSMLDDKIAEAMARKGNGIGVANLLFKSFVKLYKDHGGHDGEEGKQKGL